MDIRVVIPGMPIATPDPFAVSLGGSETAGLQLARAFARKGHRVTVFCGVQSPVRWQGVMLVPLKGYVESAAARAGDLLLIQRDPGALTLPHTAKAAFLWMHDQPGPHMVPALMAALPAVDRIVMVSQWQARRYREVAPGLAEEQILVTRNGIDLDLIAAGTRDVGERDPYRIVHTARPERGLEVLLEHVLPRILAAEPRATLHLASYDDARPEAEAYYQHLRQLADGHGARVVQHGALTKRELYRLMVTAGVYLYPTPAPIDPNFAETSCLTAMEAMACGLPWVSTDRGALPETVGDAGVLVPIGDVPDASVGDIPERLAAEALRMMHDPEHTERLRASGLTRAASLGWASVADQLVRVADETTKQPRRIASSVPRAPRPAPRARPVVAIATPIYNSLHPEYVGSLLGTYEMAHRSGADMLWVQITGISLVPSARNHIAAICLAHPSVTHILWIDGDISWAPADVFRLLAHDADFVCGLYPLKTTRAFDPVNSFAFRPLDMEVATFDQQTGLLEIAAAGCGFMLTKRSVYEQMVQAHPENKIAIWGLQHRSSHVDPLPWLYDYFPLQLEDGIPTGESYAFCNRWRALGGKVLADPSIQLIHHGACAYASDPMRMFGVAPEQAA